MTEAGNSLWTLALAQQLPRKVIWRLFRQFQSPAEAVQGYFDDASRQLSLASFQWRLIQQHHEQHVAKLLLGNDSGIRCEAVALFPGSQQLAEQHPDDQHLAGGQTPEAKHLRAPGLAGRLPRATACISSQPGCGVGCPFCSTGLLGYRGNLSAIEIVEQVYWVGVAARQRQRRLKNVVFMGMGEPLHNRVAVFEAIAWLTSDRWFGLPPRRLTVSTAGVPSGMLELAQRFPDVRLALSLHSADPAQRRLLVPRAVADLSLLHRCIQNINDLQPQQPLWLELVLFDQLNDRPEQARQLVDFCQGLRVEVNLIPYNPAANGHRFRASPRAAREAFAAIVRSAGIRATFRTSFGQDSRAACGQLQALESHDGIAK